MKSNMKKIICKSLIFLMCINCFSGMTFVKALDSVEFLYSLPNPVLYGNRKQIGVNQQNIKLVFNNTPSEDVIDGITFTASDKTAPIGGIHKTVVDNIVTVNFGELLENETYTLEIPDIKTLEFKTVSKELVCEDFSDWEIGEVIPPNTGYFSFDKNTDLKGYTTENSSFEVIEENGDRYIEIKTDALNKNMYVGTQLEKELIDAKVVSFIELKKDNPDNNPSASDIAGATGYEFNGITYRGAEYAAFNSFLKNDSGFLEVMSVSEKYDTVLTESGKASSKFSYNIYDMLSDYNTSSSSSSIAAVSDSKVYTTVAVKTYATKEDDLNDVFSLTYYRAGLYTEPEVLGIPEISGSTVKLCMNTDIGVDENSFNENVYLYLPDSGKRINVSFESYESRRLTFNISEKISDKEYIICFGSLKSKDGLKIADYENISGFYNEAISSDEINIFVSEKGNDFNSGKTGAVPFKTLERALRTINEINGYGYTKNVNLNISGTFRLDNTLSFNNLGYTLIIDGNNNATVTTAQKIPKDKFINPDDEIRQRLCKNVWDKVKVLDLDDYVPQSYMNPVGGTYKRFSVYNTDTEQKISSYPNEGYIKIGADDFEKTGTSVSDGKTYNSYSVYLDRAKGWSNGDVSIEGYFEWMWSYYRKNGYKTDSSTGKISIINLDAEIKSDDKYKVLNLIEEIDLVGEWAQENGKLYYCGEDFENIEISVANINAFTLKNTDYITVKGINFENIAGGAISVTECDNLTVSGCEFSNIGNFAVRSNSETEIRNALIENNRFNNLSYLGIDITGGDVTTLTESGNVIKGNVINDIAQHARAYSPAIKVSGVGNIIIHNTIKNSPHMCIGFSGSKNKILYNYIIDSCKETGDCGAIYAGRDFTWVDNEIAYNYIENAIITDTELSDITTNRSSFQTGIYMDDRLGGSVIHHNYIKNANRGVFLGAGSNTRVYDNVTEDCLYGGITIAGVGDTEMTFEEDSLAQAAAAFFELYPIYIEKYPWLKNVSTAEEYRHFPHNNQVYNNIHFGDSAMGGVLRNEHEIINESLNNSNNIEYIEYSDTDILNVLSEKGINIDSYLDIFDDYYLNPNPADGKLSVNEGEIKIVFTTAVTDGILNSLTFTDSDSNLPVGGIIKSVDGNEVTVKFGELKENTGYLLKFSDNVIEFTTDSKNSNYMIPKTLGEPIYDYENKTVKFVVNTDVETETLNKVAVKNIDRDFELTSFAVYNDETREITVAFSEDVYYKEEISIDLSGVKSSDGLAFEESFTVINYNTAEALSEENISYFMPEPNLKDDQRNELSNIGVNQERIKIAFDTPIDESSLSGITFVDRTGNEPVGGLIKELDSEDSEGKTVVIRFGELAENTDYILTVSDTVKNIYNKPFYEPVSRVYHTSSKVIFKDDFSNWTTGEISGLATGNNLINNTSLSLYAQSNIPKLEVTEENGDKFLKMTSDGTEDNLYLNGVFSDKKYMSEAKIVTFMDLKAQINESSETSNSIRLSSFGYNAGSAEREMGGIKTSISQDSFKSYKTVTGQTDFTPTGTVDSNNNPTFNYTVFNQLNDGTMIKSQKISHAYIAKINATIFIRNYEVSGTEYISSINSGFYVEPDIFGGTVYNKNTKTVTFAVNTDIDEETLGNFKISADGVNMENVTADFDASERTVTLSSATLENKIYTVYADGVKSADGLDFPKTLCEIDNRSAYSFENVLLTRNNNSFTMSGELNKIKPDAKSAQLWIALYSKDGKLIALKSVTSNETVSVSETFDVAITDTDVLYYYIWDSNMNPYINKQTIQ